MNWRSISTKSIPPQFRRSFTHLKMYQCDVDDGHLTVMVGQERVRGSLKWHLSISHRKNVAVARTTDIKTLHEVGTAYYPPGRIPHWEEIKNARYKFLPDHVTMAMVLPPKGQYVDEHETTMHLFQIETEK